MGTKVLAVRIGDRYGPEYEDYLKSKIPNIDFVRTSLDANSQLILSTSTDVLFIPLANASPIEAVFPYALA